MSKAKFALLAALLFASQVGAQTAGNSSEVRVKGVWRSNYGATVQIKDDGRYQYCFEGQCATGEYSRDGRGYAIVLLNVLEHPVAHRLRNLILNDDAPTIRKFMYPDLDFSVNSGVPGRRTERLCGNRPCFVLRGRGGDLIYFVNSDQP